jgi:hypothetical protein
MSAEYRPWSAAFEWFFGNLSISIWRSDSGVWGYGRTYYDGLDGYWFGLGRLLHIAWGDLNSPV